MSPVLNFTPAASSLDDLKAAIPDFAKDIRLNLGSVLTPEGAPDLSDAQIAGTALAVAYALNAAPLTAAIESFAFPALTDAQKTAAKTAASLMAMNNIYYRFQHYVENDAIKALPAKLRMQGLATHGIDRAEFELMSLAVSAVNGCGMCMGAHSQTLLDHGVTPLGVQSAIRIAAVLHAVRQALTIA